MLFFFFSSRRRHTRCGRDWSSDVCSSDLATQGDDTVDARFTVLVEQLAQVFLAVADAGQVWRGGHLHLLVELQHGVLGTVAGGATSAVGNREELGLLFGQHMGCGDQFFMAGIGLGREELEADRDVAVVHILSLGKRWGWRARAPPPGGYQ